MKSIKSAKNLFFIIAILAGTIPSVANANLLVNGDFENEPNWGKGILGDNGFTALTGTQLPGWTIMAGYAVTIHNTKIYPTISGEYSVNTDGEGYGGHNASLYQDFSTTNGQQYSLTFDWKTWSSNTTPMLDIIVIDTVTSNVLYDGNFVWSLGLYNEEAFFTGTGNPFRLQIQERPESRFNDNSYIVDNFVVTPVPVPPTMFLLGIGLAGIIRARKK
ncbi:MAG: DUF642 domain-containing protein [Desulfobulbus sp.]